MIKRILTTPETFRCLQCNTETVKDDARIDEHKYRCPKCGYIGEYIARKGTINWTDGEEHYCPCNGQCHEGFIAPCSFTCIGHHAVYGGKKE